MLKSVRLEIPWTGVPGVAIRSLAALFGGVGGGFRVSSGDPAHARVGPIALTLF
jgi:hypothetical protein